MLTTFYIIAVLFFLYLLSTLVLTYVVQQIPRNPVEDPPDWGTVTDKTIPTAENGTLEVWRIDPVTKSNGIIIFAHGWGRNRDRMVGRARLFGKWGFTTIIHSARDHGNSSRKRLMNAVKFAEDIEAVMKWVAEPVILYGHSAGSAAAIIAATRNQDMVRLLFLEGSYPFTKEALLSLYRWVNRVFGVLFGPMILFWMDLFYKGKLDDYSPARLAKQIHTPVMIIHGKKDQRFPPAFALALKESFTHDMVSLYLAKDAGHSDSSLTPEYANTVKLFIDQHLKLKPGTH